jgi:hypothetical protein
LIETFIYLVDQSTRIVGHDWKDVCKMCTKASSP